MKITDLMPDIYQLMPCGYEVLKNDTYDKILSDEVSSVLPAKKPVFYQVSGMPGAGKSAFCQHFLKSHPDYAYVSFDKIMESLPEYQQDVKQKGSALAFALWEKPARVVGYELLKRLLEQGTNVLLEHSGVNSSHVQLCENVKKYGYQTKVSFLMCDTEVAIERAQKREKMTGRHTPSKMIQERASLMPQYAAQYSKITDDIQFLDASGDTFQPIEFKY